MFCLIKKYQSEKHRNYRTLHLMELVIGTIGSSVMSYTHWEDVKQIYEILPK
ncbi:MAG: hypothetical protein JNM93_05850 [Bacteriovoracaceae bacterium]|nr:hypothetical protein [Bacteriovoracaceae bacterium]